MEIAAALLAVESLPLDHRGYVEIRTDSTDLLRWVKAGYQFIDEGFGPKIHVITGGPVCELLKAAILARSQAEIGFVYVEGHATSAWNNAVHRLANRAANRKPLLLPLIPQPSKPKAKLHPKGLRPVNRTLADALAAARKQSLDKT
jgi:ribonuclease HI